MSNRKYTLVFGHELKQTRLEAGRTQQQLAKRLRVNNTCISRVERGHQEPLNPELIRRAAKYLGTGPRPLYIAAKQTRRLRPADKDRKYTMHFGRALKEARLDVDCTQEELGVALRVSKMFISYVERGKRGPLDVARIRKAAEFLGADEEVLFEAMVSTRRRGKVNLPIQHLGPDMHENIARLACAWPKMSKRKLARMIKQMGGRRART